jgi:hypothetical protein
VSCNGRFNCLDACARQKGIAQAAVHERRVNDSQRATIPACSVRPIIVVAENGGGHGGGHGTSGGSANLWLEFIAAPLGLGFLTPSFDHDIVRALSVLPQNQNGQGSQGGQGNGGNHGAPGPIAGAGLPFLAVGYGVYWLVKRRHRQAD